jgi:hypothetical protein
VFEAVLFDWGLGVTTVQAVWFRADEHADGWEPDFRADTLLDVLAVVERENGQS